MTETTRAAALHPAASMHVEDFSAGKNRVSPLMVDIESGYLQAGLVAGILR